MTNTAIPSTPMLVEDLGMLYPRSTSKRTARYGMYQCECNNIFKAATSDIKSGHTLSCGCYKKKLTIERATKHGLRSHKMYSIWHHMVQRCTNPKDKRYKDYGDRGITVCDRWLDLEKFIEDMYPTYEEGLSIDRKNNNLGYDVDNCRWTTNSIQSQNTRRLKSNNTSGYRGVSWHKLVSKWRTQIKVNDKNICLGSFNTALEAAIVYDTYIIENNLEHTTNNTTH